MNIPQSVIHKSRIQGVKDPSKLGSHLELRFLDLWQRCGGPKLEQQYVIPGDRKYAYDFAHLKSRLLIELQGGVHSYRPSHASAKGIIRDSQKSRYATLKGWRVIPIVGTDITAETVRGILEITGGTE